VLVVQQGVQNVQYCTWYQQYLFEMTVNGVTPLLPTVWYCSTTPEGDTTSSTCTTVLHVEFQGHSTLTCTTGTCTLIVVKVQVTERQRRKDSRFRVLIGIVPGVSPDCNKAMDFIDHGIITDYGLMKKYYSTQHTTK
jgi:hypothetical protein